MAEGIWGSRELCLAIFTYSAQRNVHARFTILSLRLGMASLLGVGAEIRLPRYDRAKTKVLRMSQFGIIEITRQRMRPSLKRSIYFDCPHCKGAGLVKTPESISTIVAMA